MTNALVNLPKRVLIVEDRLEMVVLWKRCLNEHFGIANLAFTHFSEVVEAENFFYQCEDEKSPFDAIIMDACVPGNKPNTMELVKLIRNFYPLVPIIPASSDHFFSRQLVEAGANEELIADKMDTSILFSVREALNK